MKHLDRQIKRKEYCSELVYSTELGRRRYIDFIKSSNTSLNMRGTANQLRVPPMQTEIKRGGYMYRKRLCPKNM